MSVKGVNEPHRRTETGHHIPTQARDKEVIAYFQHAVQAKDRLPGSKHPNCPESEKKTLDGRGQAPNLGGRRPKKIIRL